MSYMLVTHGGVPFYGMTSAGQTARGAQGGHDFTGPAMTSANSWSAGRRAGIGTRFLGPTSWLAHGLARPGAAVGTAQACFGLQRLFYR